MKGQDIIRRCKEKNKEARTCHEVIKVFTISTEIEELEKDMRRKDIEVRRKPWMCSICQAKNKKVFLPGDGHGCWILLSSQMIRAQKSVNWLCWDETSIFSREDSVEFWGLNTSWVRSEYKLEKWEQNNFSRRFTVKGSPVKRWNLKQEITYMQNGKKISVCWFDDAVTEWN